MYMHCTHTSADAHCCKLDVWQSRSRIRPHGFAGHAEWVGGWLRSDGTCGKCVGFTMMCSEMRRRDPILLLDLPTHLGSQQMYLSR